METYILIITLPYEGPWIKGVAHSLDEASEYFSNKIQAKRTQELVLRALADNWEEDYFSYWAEKWRGTQRICTYKYNTKTKTLVKQPKRFGEEGENDDENEN